MFHQIFSILYYNASMLNTDESIISPKGTTKNVVYLIKHTLFSSKWEDIYPTNPNPHSATYYNLQPPGKTYNV